MVGVIFVYIDMVFGLYGYSFVCLVGCFSMIIWTRAVLSVLYACACVLYFCICTCSAQSSMFHMERRSRNTLIIMIKFQFKMVEKSSEKPSARSAPSLTDRPLGCPQNVAMSAIANLTAFSPLSSIITSVYIAQWFSSSQSGTFHFPLFTPHQRYDVLGYRLRANTNPTE